MAHLKVILTLIKVFLMSHIVYNIHYVNSFYSLYYCHHYDHCLVNIANIICRPGACISLKEYGFCLFICLIAGSEYVDKSKPIFLLLKFFYEENSVRSLRFLFITESFIWDTSDKTTCLTTLIWLMVWKQVNGT